MFTVDEQRGIVYIPVEKTDGNGVNDYWGGGAPGDIYFTPTRSSRSTRRRER